jgi:hypothetical protein
MGHKAQANGKSFESAFHVMANLCGFKVKPIPTMGRWMGSNLFKPIPGWSDFMLIAQDGRSAFVDCKSTIETAFSYSKVNQDQIAFFQSVGDLCPAGYVVYFVPFNTVVFYEWQKLQALRPEESLGPDAGIVLGKIPALRIQDIMGVIKRDQVA